MKIYFAGSITGGRNDQELYFSIISELQKYGTVLTEHVGNKDLTEWGEVKRTVEEIYKGDMDLMREADLVVAEITAPSLGVGYELREVEVLGKPVLCLYKNTEGKRPSAMISGNKYFGINTYRNFDEIVAILKKYFESNLF